MDGFTWTQATEEAALLIAQGNLTTDEIAKQVGIVRSTLWLWRKNEEFKARVERHLEEIRAEIKRVGIADTLRRVSYLNDRVNRMRRVIEARADDREMAEVPGGTTGLMVRTVKSVGGGENAQLVYEYAVDTGLLKELREHEKQAAQELGQWTERKAVEDARKAYDVRNSPGGL